MTELQDNELRLFDQDPVMIHRALRAFYYLDFRSHYVKRSNVSTTRILYALRSVRWVRNGNFQSMMDYLIDHDLICVSDDTKTKNIYGKVVKIVYYYITAHGEKMFSLLSNFYDMYGKVVESPSGRNGVI